MNKLMYRFVATRKKKKKKRNRPVFRHGMPLQGIPRKNSSYEEFVLFNNKDILLDGSTIFYTNWLKKVYTLYKMF